MTTTTNYNIDGQCPHCGSYSRSCQYQENGSELIADCTCNDCKKEYREYYKYYCTEYEQESEVEDE